MADIGFGPARTNSGKNKIEKARSPYKNPTKDFRKVLKKEKEDGQRDQEENVVKEGKGDEKSQRPQRVAKEKSAPTGQSNVSLFDLPKEARKQEALKEEKKLAKKKGQKKGIAEEIQQESLSALMKQMNAKNLQKEAIATSGESKVSTQFAQEQPDLSYVNPMASGTTAATITSIQTAIPASQAAEMVEIMEQLIDKLYIVEKQGETDTTITLRHPPLFEGAKLIVTSFDTAKGEFNLKFEGLTQQGKTILDLPDNQNALRMALDQKGYVVHIVTTTTYDESQIGLEGEAYARGEREGEEEQQKQREQEEEA